MVKGFFVNANEMIVYSPHDTAEYIGTTLYDASENPVYVVDVVQESESKGRLRSVYDSIGVMVGFVDENSYLVIQEVGERPNPHADLGYE